MWRDEFEWFLHLIDVDPDATDPACKLLEGDLRGIRSAKFPLEKVADEVDRLRQGDVESVLGVAPAEDFLPDEREITSALRVFTATTIDMWIEVRAEWKSRSRSVPLPRSGSAPTEGPHEDGAPDEDLDEWLHAAIGAVFRLFLLERDDQRETRSGYWFLLRDEVADRFVDQLRRPAKISFAREVVALARDLANGLVSTQHELTRRLLELESLSIITPSGAPVSMQSLTGRDLARDMEVDPRHAGDEVRDGSPELAGLTPQKSPEPEGASSRCPHNIDAGSGDARLHVKTKVIALAMDLSDHRVRDLVHEHGLPVIAPTVKPMMFDAAAVWAWCRRKNRPFDVSKLPEVARERLERKRQEYLDHQVADRRGTERRDRQQGKLRGKDRKPDVD